MAQGFDLLATTRLNAIMEVARGAVPPPEGTMFLATTPDVPAEDEEIMAGYSGRVTSADIIADDQAAVVRHAGRVELKTTDIPNLKQGAMINQSTAKLLGRLNRGGGVSSDLFSFQGYTRREVANRLQAVRILKERMLAGCRIDLFAYNKLGVVYSNVSWNMPSALKFVPANDWDDATNGTPIDDLLTYKQYGADNYGENYNRYTCSLKQFRYAVATTNFRNQAKIYTPLANDAVTFANLIRSDGATTLFEQITGLKIRFNDNVYQDELNDGSKLTRRYIPANVGFLDNSADDNNSGTFDFANGVVTESVIGRVPGVNVIGGAFANEEFGPVAYATVKGDLNPPNVTIWGVARGFPRKHRPTATARVWAYDSPSLDWGPGTLPDVIWQ